MVEFPWGVADAKCLVGARRMNKVTALDTLNGPP
jgi:hypothetical protein